MKLGMIVPSPSSCLYAVPDMRDKEERSRHVERATKAVGEAPVIEESHSLPYFSKP